jgi:2-C-methyl-D-erythritol 4-phosphate cytidylyltransferase
MKYYAIVVAGGRGSRMKEAIPKQFLLLQGKPILMYSIAAFHNCGLNPEILLVLNVDQHNYWDELCQQYAFTIPHRVISGGEQRFHSVSNALRAIKGNGLVAVHDAVRPLISPMLISKCFHSAEELGNVIMGVTPTDSVRKITANNQTEALNRNMVALIQTPQTFDVNLLKKAYLQPYRNDFTDDASVVEFMGTPINLIEGQRSNIKITYPEDLELAELYIKKKASE